VKAAKDVIMPAKPGPACLVTRLTKIMMCGALGAFGLLVAADNVVDYGTNYAFVQHVLSMDTIFPDSRLAWRAIHDPALWRAGYALIIAAEALTGLLFLAGTLQMLRRLRAPAAEFHAAKALAIAGAGMGFGVWFVGFLLVGGEWFQMWQSREWNGQQAAFRFVMVILAVLIFLNQPERDDAGGPPRAP
jgi:predicted small integral membrane protein